MNTDHEGLDVLVIGSGIAGLSAAIPLAGRRRIAVLAKEAPGGGSTALAQGGIAAALSPHDSTEAHASDTVAAAAGLCQPDVAAVVTAASQEAVAVLSDLGVNFDVGAPAKEGGHSAARVVHAKGDATGAEISRALLEAARDRGVPVVGQSFLIELLVTPDAARVVGALVWDARAGALRAIRASTVLMASGGYGQLWGGTTSSPACTGDGVATVMRAGAQVADLEFVQFHPTGMVLGRDPRPLASEALRGAGARLRDANGDYLHLVTRDGVGDLAPRDVVSRAMQRRMEDLGVGYCYLDATMLGRAALEQRFPTFYGACSESGIDPAQQWVPVSPTAHYTMGGILTDADGRTTLEGLMAVGEVACSGLHGANRLASNSLLEGAVIGRRAAAALLATAGPAAPRDPVRVDGVLVPATASRGRPSSPLLARGELRAAMDKLAGVARDGDGLEALTEHLCDPRPPCSPEGPSEAAELANMILVARGVVAAALRREESRGAHWRTDCPGSRPEWRRRQVLQLLPGDELAVGDLAVGDVSAGDRPTGDAAPGAVAEGAVTAGAVAAGVHA